MSDPEPESETVQVITAFAADAKKRVAHSGTLKEVKNTNTYIDRSEMIGTKKYIIHDNFTIPWVVFCDKKEIKIVPVEPWSREEPLGDKEAEIITVTDFEGYWSGYDSSLSKKHGNSILVKIKTSHETGTELLYIGANIAKFNLESGDDVMDFITPIGNSDVPYPVTYTKKYVIFMLNIRAVLASSLITPATVATAEDIYSEFYGHIHPENLEKQKRTSLRHEYIRYLKD